MLIGLCGYAQSGKNTVANILTEEAGFVQMAFADALRDMAYRINPVIDEDDGRYAEVLDGWGYEEAKRIYPEVREYLQRLGTAVRDVLGPDVWVDAVRKRYIDSLNNRIVVTDVRFPNEADFILGEGQLWRVNRPGVGPVNAHVSESHIADFLVDREIDNSGDLADLRKAVKFVFPYGKKKAIGRVSSNNSPEREGER